MPKIADEELKHRVAALSAEIKRLLPDFVESCRKNEDVVIIHQDSFAADYQDDEYKLLGMAIKFAGLHGKEVRIIGTNRETLKGSGKPELIQ
jgi:predicted AAA+ superfamily ATPase